MGKKQSKFDYGIHETEILQSHDAPEVKSKIEKCTKEHKKYILPKDLTLGDLPEMFREDDIYDFVKCMAGITVRIHVTYSSPRRKKYWQGTEAEYPGYRSRGHKLCMVGSGRIGDVFQNEAEVIKCPCKTCKSKKSSETEVWNILVFTATHVVYDSIEAERSNYKFFYDTGDGKVKVFYGVKKLWSNVSGDLCLLSCATCDRELADSLRETIKTFNKLWTKIRENYKSDKGQPAEQRKYTQRLVIVVSHPHGGEKRISLGKLLGKEKKLIKSSKGWHINYDASTCAGSSGSPVYLFGQDYFVTEYVHSGCNENLNYSTTWCPAKTKT